MAFASAPSKTAAPPPLSTASPTVARSDDATLTDDRYRGQQQAMTATMPSAGYVVSMKDVATEVAVRATVELLQRVLAAPLDRAMVLTAVEGELVRQGRLPRDGFGGILRCYKRLWRREGARGLLRGVLVDAALAVPSMAVDAVAGQVVYTVLRVLVPHMLSDAEMTPLRVVVLTQVVLFATSWVAAPYNAFRKTIVTNYVADLVAPVPAATRGATTTMRAHTDDKDTYRYASASDVAAGIYRRWGWRGFVRGMAVDPLAVCVYRGIYVAAVMGLGEGVMAHHPLLLRRTLAVVTSIVTQPFEVVGRRLVLTASDAREEQRYDGVVDCVRDIVRTEGVTALWSGLKFRLLLTAASIGVAAAFGAVVSTRRT